ncbi:MAG: ATPase [Desulfobacterales bacterium]|jgi:F-type H+-transporting ATPase subunit b|nr:ATPase [Desulfobacteraceae bacterium]MBT7086763.1 ATPase [Desulfobacterales bacterium]MBT7698082.1 ATPase [Desulfobacterales bacterium]
MLTLDNSLYIQMINFIFLVIAMNFIVYKPIRKILTQRKDKVDGLQQNIDTCKNDISERDNDLKEGVKKARNQGNLKKEAILQEAAEEEAAIIEEINKKAQENLKDVREKIIKDVEEVKASLLQEVDTFAGNIGQKILGRAV